jgi:hypothetical protein
MSRTLSACLIGLRLLMVVLIIRGASNGTIHDSDVTRFRQIATSSGTPWRDFDVEYMPGELVLIEVLTIPARRGTVIAVCLVSLFCDLSVAAVLLRRMGGYAARTYLMLGTPLLVFLYLRLDLVPVLLVALAAVLGDARRDRSAGALFGIAAITKLWPLVILPFAIVEGRSRILAWALGVLLVGGLLWMAWGGTGALFQVASFRHAAGWEAESGIGSLVWIFTGGPVEMEQGAPRIGSISPWVRPLLVVALLATVSYIWRRARHWPDRLEGAPALAALCGLLTWAPVFSLQYAAWLLVPAAIASTGERGRQATSLAFGATLMTGLLFISYGSTSSALVQAELLVRNSFVVAIVGWWFYRTREPQVRETPGIESAAT